MLFTADASLQLRDLKQFRVCVQMCMSSCRDVRGGQRPSFWSWFFPAACEIQDELRVSGMVDPSIAFGSSPRPGNVSLCIPAVLEQGEPPARSCLPHPVSQVPGLKMCVTTPDSGVVIDSVSYGHPLTFKTEDILSLKVVFLGMAASWWCPDLGTFCSLALLCPPWS